MSGLDDSLRYRYLGRRWRHSARRDRALASAQRHFDRIDLEYPPTTASTQSARAFLRIVTVWGLSKHVSFT